MANFIPQAHHFPLEEQIKTLGDDELLDFWEETQFLEKMLGEEFDPGEAPTQEYERIILQELQFRSCKRGLGV